MEYQNNAELQSLFYVMLLNDNLVSLQNVLLSKLNTCVFFVSFFVSVYLFFYIYRCAILEKDLAKNQEEHSREGRTLRNKMDATVEFLKQEHAVAMNKVMMNN